MTALKLLADYNTIRGHVFVGHLQPTTRGSTEIDTASCCLEKGIFFVELDELEGGTSTVALFPCIAGSAKSLSGVGGMTYFASL